MSQFAPGISGHSPGGASPPIFGLTDDTLGGAAHRSGSLRTLAASPRPLRRSQCSSVRKGHESSDARSGATQLGKLLPPGRGR